ncbi:unnamed protein product [Cochlearia groenlandica]
MTFIHVASWVLFLFLLMHLYDSRHIKDSMFPHVKDQNVISGLKSEEPVRVSRFVPGQVKHVHRGPSFFLEDYPKPSTRPPRHN